MHCFLCIQIIKNFGEGKANTILKCFVCIFCAMLEEKCRSPFCLNEGYFLDLSVLLFFFKVPKELLKSLINYRWLLVTGYLSVQ